MRKCFVALTGFLLALLISGCGGNSTTSSTIISGVTPETIKSTEIPASNTFYIKQKGGLSTTYTYDPNANPSSLSSDGSKITLTNNSDNKQYTFSRIQTESDYWLVFDTSTSTSTFAISRLYLAPPPSTYDPTIMGGTIQPVTPLNVVPSAADPPKLYGNGSTTGGYLDASGTSAKFNQPRGITYDKGTASFYVADSANHVIRKIDPTTKNVTTIAGHAGVSGSDTPTTSTGSKGVDAFFNTPKDITTDGTNLYVADTGNHTIRQIELSSGYFYVKTIAGVAGSAGAIDNSVGTSAYFNGPSGITTDGTNLYVTDSGNCTIRKVRLFVDPNNSSINHSVSTIAGSPGISTVLDGTYTSAFFGQPLHLTTDGTNLYVIDFQIYGDSAIRKVVIATGVVTTFVGGGGTFTYGHLGGITTDGTYLYMGYNSKDLTVTSIRKKKISDNSNFVDLTNITSMVGTIPPFGLTSDGTNLFFSSAISNSIYQMN